MELLVATLAYTLGSRDADVLARIRLIADTVHNAPGMIDSRFYRGRGKEPYYFALTTWDDDESWQRAQERHNPGQLLLENSADLLTTPPKQWLMRYLWGYSRSTATSAMAAVHLATPYPAQVDTTQQQWLQRLRQQTLQSALSFAFLARGSHETPKTHASANVAGSQDTAAAQSTMLLNLLSWANDSDREKFYAHPGYQAIHKMVKSAGMMHVLSLELM
ncbi:MAG TPA: hypothetical protein VFU49_10810 [Ktedonobacteraceae bacterium]|nr:hypothetical protein [Ktedonobacteraceae bacterium]